MANEIKTLAELRRRKRLVRRNQIRIENEDDFDLKQRIMDATMDAHRGIKKVDNMNYLYEVYNEYIQPNSKKTYKTDCCKSQRLEMFKKFRDYWILEEKLKANELPKA